MIAFAWLVPLMWIVIGALVVVFIACHVASREVEVCCACGDLQVIGPIAVCDARDLREQLLRTCPKCRAAHYDAAYGLQSPASSESSS